ncbi:MAG TPA: hypothetical protein VKP88_07205, partial [Candidatus Paceibacterota bacterium]|nr:hypothetical protein [Candidatus Paceibacterota bacterium]
ETQVEQAQRELQAAQETGDKLKIEEKKRALEKAKIEEKYRKRRIQAEYQMQLQAWKFQLAQAYVQLAMAPLNAYASTAAIPVVGPFLAPIQAALALGAASIQVAAVQAARPEPPKFATGGIVPGNQKTGDTVPIQANSGEMVLNDAQQAKLFDMANGGGKRRVAPLSAEMTWQDIFDASQRGELFIDERAVVRR